MKLIPVIDLLQGQAVMALRGQRQSYQPLSTPLCPDSRPEQVIEAYLGLYPFDCIYIADLDSIQSQGNNHKTITSLQRRFPHLQFWVDAGYPVLPHSPPIIPVIGSESLQSSDLAVLPSLSGNWILSLDFKGNGFLGPLELLENTMLWPKSVIIMTLAKVGSLEGPDWNRLRSVVQRDPSRHWIAAGGIRHQQDCNRLARFGIHCVLVASALHYGKIKL